VGLFAGLAGPERRTTGILPSQEIRELIATGKIRSTSPVEESQIQPATLDLRLGRVAHRIEASFLPRLATIESKVRDLEIAETIDLASGALLEKGGVFIISLQEGLALPANVSGRANAKSTTGRLDIFAKLVTEGATDFDEVPQGYSGDLYLEVVPRTFPIVVKEGVKLNQLRLFRGVPHLTDGPLRGLSKIKSLVFDDQGSPTTPVIDHGLRLSIDLVGNGKRNIVAYKAKRTARPVDLSKVGLHDAPEFWDFIPGIAAKGLVLDPDAFYLLGSKERVSVPLEYAAEMVPFDPSIGEFSVHYAGFFDPGFGYGAHGEIKGSKAVLEVRAHEVPILLEDGQIVSRLEYHGMAEVPDITYGCAIGSSYQEQGLALSKQFRNSVAIAV
jgi:dCTP deaminase